ALADHHRPVDRQSGELRTHGIDRGLIGGKLVAAPAQPCRGDRRPLRDPNQLEGQDAVEHRGVGFCHVLEVNSLIGRARPACGKSGGRAIAGRHCQQQAARYSARSIRITCGLSTRWPSLVTPSTALRTAASVVSWVTRITVLRSVASAARWTID